MCSSDLRWQLIGTVELEYFLWLFARAEFGEGVAKSLAATLIGLLDQGRKHAAGGVMNRSVIITGARKSRIARHQRQGVDPTL